MNENSDNTPTNFMIPYSRKLECIKKIFRKLFYPCYVYLNNFRMKIIYKNLSISPDIILMGQRGNDYERLRYLVNKNINLKGKTILIIGCGTGRDVISWLPYKPEKIIAIDYFNYQNAWNKISDYIVNSFGDTEIEFRQLDIAELEASDINNVDIIASDAVFEHLRDFKENIEQLVSVLKKNGVLYATFGPLWYTWGGDHVSGFDSIESGFNHLNLGESAYDEYLKSFGEHVHSEHDGRTWVYNKLFSYLKPRDYIDILNNAGMERLHVRSIIEKRAIKLLSSDADLKKKMLSIANYNDLITTGMTIIYRKT